MSDIIHVLPDSVANQIAAGEVIQRPASVIKELVENSLDAGATKVQVFVTDAGKTSIQVIDNGKGMSETDARCSFERHATSKISNANDLYALTTMGFRGEALASIAAVSQVELRTRTSDDELGVCICNDGAYFTSQEPISCPVGANFIVKNLFFNIPVRRKFLKSNQTEMGQIVAEFDRIALAHPEITFSLSSQDTILKDLPSGSFRQRIVNIFGKKLDKQLLNVEVETPIVKIVGFVGTPESSKKKGAQQFFFVNGRYMRHPYFAKAVITSFDRLVPEGNQVPFFLHLFVDPSKIDVNIHPTKTEIKFEDEQTIWSILQAAIRESLGKFNAIPTIDFDTTNRPDIPLFGTDKIDIHEPEVNIDPSFNPFDTEHQQQSTKTSTAYSPHYSSRPTRNLKNWDDALQMEELVEFQQQKSTEQDVVGNDIFTEIPAAIDNAVPDWDPRNAEYMQYQGRYLLTTVSTGLLFIDAHRAHYRILYEEFMKRASTSTPSTQGLLFPQLLELSPLQNTYFSILKDDFLALGFSFELTNGQYYVTGIPSEASGLDPLHLMANILDDAAENAVDAKDILLHKTVQTLARRSAIPVGQHLSQEEMKDITAQLFATSNPNLTPDGKIILSIIQNDSILSRFK